MSKYCGTSVVKLNNSEVQFSPRSHSNWLIYAAVVTCPCGKATKKSEMMRSFKGHTRDLDESDIDLQLNQVMCG